MKKTLISIIVPVYNEEGNVVRAYEALCAELGHCSDIDIEIIFTDNHSTDKSFKLLQSISEKDNRVKVIRFSRNFGFNKSILTGYRYACGDAAVQIDCDLEDPPSVIHEFIRLWRSGHDVVVGIRACRAESRLMIFARTLFYKVLNKISESPHQINAGDFRLIDRSILEQLKIIDDAQPYVRGLTSELARNEAGVAYARDHRKFGESKFPLRQLVMLALDGIYGHSTVPLKIAMKSGILIAFVTLMVIVGFILSKIFFGAGWPAGYTTTIVLILFGISLNALLLGIIGEYVARIYQQVKTRPTTIIEKTINVNATVDAGKV